VLVKLVSSAGKRDLIANISFRRNLRKEQIKIDDDLTKEQRDTLRELRREGHVAYYRGSKLVSRRRSTGQDAAYRGETGSRMWRTGRGLVVAGISPSSRLQFHTS
jgi:hypothetical protein